MFVKQARSDNFSSYQTDIMQGMEATRCAIKSFNLMRRAATYLCHLAVSVLVQEMASCLLEPNHYLNNYQLLILRYQSNINEPMKYFTYILCARLHWKNNEITVCKSPSIFIGLYGIGFHDNDTANIPTLIDIGLISIRLLSVLSWPE